MSEEDRIEIPLNEFSSEFGDKSHKEYKKFKVFHSGFTETIGTLDTAIRVIKIEKYQRYCLNCGKILPLKIKQNYYHECEKPDFVKDKLGI